MYTKELFGGALFAAGLTVAAAGDFTIGTQNDGNYVGASSGTARGFNINGFFNETEINSTASATAIGSALTISAYANLGNSSVAYVLNLAPVPFSVTEDTLVDLTWDFTGDTDGIGGNLNDSYIFVSGPGGINITQNLLDPVGSMQLCLLAGETYFYRGIAMADGGVSQWSMVINTIDDCNDCNNNLIPDECDTAPDGDPSIAVEQDMCEDAMLVCPGFDYVGNNLTATNSDGIFFCGLFYGIQDVYYRYRPAWDGLTFIRVEGPPIYWLYSVYDDCPSNGGVEITCNEQDHFNVTFNAQAGQTYYIRIASWGQNPLGSFEMNIVGPDCALADNDLNGNGVPDECECPADVNGDMTVDMLDFVEAVMNFGPCFMFPCNSDVDGDGEVDNTDLSIILNSQGPCPLVQVRKNLGSGLKLRK